MTRYFNFFILLGAIGVLTVLFYRVMATFLVPLFLAVLLVVIFRPVHVWIVKACKNRKKIAALLTTMTILVLVLAPLTLLFVLAISEGQTAMRRFTPESIMRQALRMRDSLNLTIPAIDELRDVETHLETISNSILLDDPSEDILRKLAATDAAAKRLQNAVKLPADPVEPRSDSALAMFAISTKEELWGHFLFDLDRLKLAIDKSMEAMQKLPEFDLQKSNREAPSVEADRDLVDKIVNVPTEGMPEEMNVEQASRELLRAFDAFKTNLCGGKSWAWMKLMANPTREEVDGYSKNLAKLFREQLLSLGGATTAFLGRAILGLVIMVISLYFFLVDGPKMVQTLKQLSPLHDEQEQELINEFDRVSRAVVVATLLAALVQGLLAGIGFFFVGLDNVFLLTMLTVCLAMVPFFGAAAVWVPACAWLYFVENRMGAAIGLAIYGAVIVSTADNFIKPFVLHGQSNIHPLVALLSVLGGVTALGPIGILIGPMIVVFLQTVLKIMHRELLQMDRGSKTFAASDVGEIRLDPPQIVPDNKKSTAELPDLKTKQEKKI